MTQERCKDAVCRRGSQSERLCHFLSARALPTHFAEMVKQRNSSIQKLSASGLIDFSFIFYRSHRESY